MVVKWTYASLGAVAEFRNGVNYTKDNFGDGIKVINVGDFQGLLVAPLSELGQIRPDGVVREESLLRDGDIVFVRSNGNRELIGRSLILCNVFEPVTHSAFTIRVRFVSSHVVPLFYAYLFRSRLIRDVLSAQGNGTNISNLNQTILAGLRVPVPPLSAQRAIANVLSAYDDLIENNTKRIKILEEMARSLYREWFVQFRFPGHNQVKLVGTQIGRAPQGWSVRSVSEAVDINPRTPVPRDGSKPFVPMGSLSNDSMLISDVEMRDGNSGSKFMNGDTLLARITPCLENGKTGYVQFLSEDEPVAFGSTEYVVMRERALTREMIYLLARSDAFRDHAMKSMTGASGRQRVQDRCFNTYLLAVPPSSLAERFTKVVRPIFRSVHLLASKNEKLRATRDLLLPRLISGELDVSSLPLPADATS